MLQVKNIFLLLPLLFVAVFPLVPKVFAADPCDQITDPPLLYEIDRASSSATLFFTPLNDDQVQTYTIIYGLKPEDERYSLTVNQGVSTGAISYKINDLLPGVAYSYKVSGATTCTSSPWSSWVTDKAVTKGIEKIIPTSALPVTGSETTIVAALSFAAILGGLSLFALARRKS